MERKLQTERQMHQNDVERMEKRVSELRHANESERARIEQIQKEAALRNEAQKREFATALSAAKRENENVVQTAESLKQQLTGLAQERNALAERLLETLCVCATFSFSLFAAESAVANSRF